MQALPCAGLLVHFRRNAPLDGLANALMVRWCVSFRCLPPFFLLCRCLAAAHGAPRTGLRKCVSPLSAAFVVSSVERTQSQTERTPPAAFYSLSAAFVFSLIEATKSQTTERLAAGLCLLLHTFQGLPGPWTPMSRGVLRAAAVSRLLCWLS